MKRLRVLFITAWYPDKDHPVAGTFVREHAKAVLLYDDVVVLHCCGRDPKYDYKRLWRMEKETDEALAEGIPTWRLWQMPMRVAVLCDLILVCSILWAFRRIVAGGFRPHIIHAHVYEAGLPAVIVGKLRRIPVVVTEHFTGFPRRVLKRRAIRRARMAFRSADRVTPVSKSLQNAIEGYGIQARFQVVPNVVDTRLFRPSRASLPRSVLKRLLVVGVFSSARTKGIPYLLKALAQLRRHRDDWRLDIVGDGPVRAEYMRLAESLGLGDKATFHGLKPKSEVAELMRASDLVVVPSVFETFSVVAAEALATGTPVLATRCGGPEEFVTDAVGRVVRPGDTQALQEGLDYMLSHLDRFVPVEICRYAVERFSPERVGQQLHAVYAGCLASNAS